MEKNAVNMEFEELELWHKNLERTERAMGASFRTWDLTQQA